MPAPRQPSSVSSNGQATSKSLSDTAKSWLLSALAFLGFKSAPLDPTIISGISSMTTGPTTQPLASKQQDEQAVSTRNMTI